MMITIGPIQLYLIIAALVILVAVVSIIFAQAFKMGFKYGADYAKSKYRRHNEMKNRESVSQYYRTDIYDTGVGSVRVRKQNY